MTSQAPKARTESRVLSICLRVSAADGAENKEPHTPLLSVQVLFCSPVSFSFSTDLFVPNKSIYYSNDSQHKTVSQDQFYSEMFIVIFLFN